MASGGSEGEGLSEVAGTEGAVFPGLSSCQEMPVTALNATFPVRDFAWMLGGGGGPADPEGSHPFPLSEGLYGVLG